MNGPDSAAELPLPAPPDADQLGGDRFETAIMALAAARGEAKSFCPTDVARTLSEEWRPLLGRRAAARRLAEAGRIDILRHGKPIDPAAIKGVIRLRLKRG